MTSVGLISGTGAEGRGIALRLAAAGVAVMLGSRSAEKAKKTAGELNSGSGDQHIRGAENPDVIARCDLLYLTVPFAHAESVLESYAEDFQSGQVLVDVTVPVVFDAGPRMLQLPEGSASEFVQSRVPDKIPVVAAFKTLPAHLLSRLDEPLDCDEFLCGDSEEAKRRVREVVEHIDGLRWIDAGPLRYARALEAMTYLAIGLNRRFQKKAARFRVVGL